MNVKDTEMLDTLVKNATSAAFFDLPIPEGTLIHGTKSTIANLKALLKHYGITCEYNEISKAQSLRIAGQQSHDLSENSNYALLRSLLALNNLPQSTVDLIPFLMTENTVNPVLDFIHSQQPAKNMDMFRFVADTLVVDDVDIEYRDLALKTWLLQCVAAADYAVNTKNPNATPKFELVLVLQGEQGLGKSTWLKNLLPPHLHEYFAENEHLDPNDVNSLRRCLSSWICEIGELDATFRKSDMERLKAFLSQSVDKIRLPYDRAISNYKRRTSFCASVNISEFLVDRTGNRRFLPIAVKSIQRINAMQDELFLAMFWAQIYAEYNRISTQWWASAELESMLTERHHRHAEISPIDELIGEVFDLQQHDDRFAKHYTITKVLMACGVSNPTKNQVKEAKSFIEKNGFNSVQSSGSRGYYLTRQFNDAQ